MTDDNDRLKGVRMFSPVKLNIVELRAIRGAVFGEHGIKVQSQEEAAEKRRRELRAIIERAQEELNRLAPRLPVRDIAKPPR